MAKKILVVGGGGREHAIIKALKKSPDCGEVWCAPGNGGIGYDADNDRFDIRSGRHDIRSDYKYSWNIRYTGIGRYGTKILYRSGWRYAVLDQLCDVSFHLVCG